MMPSSRFFGYYNFMGECNKTPKEIEEEAKEEAMRNADWSDEVKKLKRKMAHGKKVEHSNPLKN